MAENSTCSSASSCSKSSCEGCPSKQNPQSFLVDMNAFSDIKHVIGVVSGKGGVGKSMVTASLANQLASKGYRVGIMDADITGPSIPKMYGLHQRAVADDQGIYPAITDNDIKVISINLLMPNEESPVIWRGPVIAGMVKQFWSDVIWGGTGLSSGRYASWNRRCSADSVSVSSGRGNCDCIFSTGSGADDCKESL